ncbi:MAG: cysteine desulfurase [Gammaproteobacteria bacterium]|nr:MAG: cysteine desulfurase [Gammaproteobacteria bacterium]
MSMVEHPVALKRIDTFDVNKVRADFPALQQQIHGHPLVYLDSGATAQKPKSVIEALERFYAHDYANVHRAVHSLGERATQAFEGAREKVKTFIRARSTREIVFVRGTTEAINLVAQSFARPAVRAGDEIVLTQMEHHSNIVPWQLLREQTGIVLRVVPVNDAGELVIEELEKLINPRTRLVTLVHLSNALGTINPVRRIIETAHAANVPVLLDGAQAVPHLGVDVQDLDCDFYAFSAHKLYGPSGIGVLYAKEEILDAMPPYHGGGEMIRYVSFDKTEYNDLPYKFEAGTPNIAGAVGLGAAIDYLNTVGIERVAAYESNLLDYATEAVGAVPGLHIIGTARSKASILSFDLDGVHPHDIGTILDRQGIAVRAGHHCAMPVMRRFGVPATTRASFGMYNTREEIDALVAGIQKARELIL